MFSWWKKKRPEPERAPMVRREKTYSAASGQVYQYRFAEAVGDAHVFDVSEGRGAGFPVRVRLEEAGLRACEARMGTPLRWNERYALAKLKLMRAMDEAASAEELRRGVMASEGEMLEFLRELRMSEE